MEQLGEGEAEVSLEPFVAPNPVPRPCHRFTATSPPDLQTIGWQDHPHTKEVHDDHRTGPGRSLISALVGTRRFFTKAAVSQDRRTIDYQGGRQGDSFYRDRWAHDKVVRSTHGVNCTGSCSWKVYVKDGVITWESQQTDYPSTGPDKPEYEPAAAPRRRGLLLVHLLPTRVRYPYVRGVLLEMYRAAKAEHPDPVDAWASIVTDPEKARAYKSVRGKGGLVRSTWAEVDEPIAAAYVHTIEAHGPDRIAGFSPSPRCPRSPMPPAPASTNSSAPRCSPSTTGMPTYPTPRRRCSVTRPMSPSPATGGTRATSSCGLQCPVDPHAGRPLMTEARYRGQKVIAVAPDYAENVKFADEWVTTAPGTDGALAMAMGHVLLKEYFVDRSIDFFTDYNQRFTDVPFLITLEDNGSGAYTPGKFLVAGMSTVTPRRPGERDVEADGHGRRDR